jgi:hypothetical protein
LVDEYQSQSGCGVLAIGGRDLEGIDVAAQLLALGLDPLRFLNTTDPFERGMMIELAGRTQKYRQMLDENLANAVANAVGKLFR